MTKSEKNQLILKVALCVAIVALLVVCFAFYQQYQHVKRLGYGSHRQPLLLSLHGSGPLSASDASSTAAWMTFGYINRAFGMPQSYLETELDVFDSRYPRMTIIEYAKDAGISEAAALAKVQTAIVAYFASNQ